MITDGLGIEVLKGQVLAKIVKDEVEDEIFFYTTDSKKYRMFHFQDCCEQVYIEDICGDLDDLLGYPVLQAEEVSYYNEDPDGVTTKEYTGDSFTWTFYKLATIKGSVTIRWFGESSGYYSESVDFEEVKN